jgi:hypothetical protein
MAAVNVRTAFSNLEIEYRRPECDNFRRKTLAMPKFVQQRRSNMNILTITVLVILTMWRSAWGQGTKPKTLDELVAYSGVDRQKIILEGAKAEGKSRLVYLVVG